MGVMKRLQEKGARRARARRATNGPGNARPRRERPDYVPPNDLERDRSRSWFRRALKRGTYEVDSATGEVVATIDGMPRGVEIVGTFKGVPYFRFEHRGKTRTLSIEDAISVAQGQERKPSSKRTSVSLKADDPKAAALQVIEGLAKVDRRFKGTSWQERWAEGYSPRQILLLLMACSEHGIPFAAEWFRINCDREEWAAQVYLLKPWQYEQVRAAITPARREGFDTYFASQETGNPPSRRGPRLRR